MIQLFLSEAASQLRAAEPAALSLINYRGSDDAVSPRLTLVPWNADLYAELLRRCISKARELSSSGPPNIPLHIWSGAVGEVLDSWTQSMTKLASGTQKAPVESKYFPDARWPGVLVETVGDTVNAVAVDNCLLITSPAGSVDASEPAPKKTVNHRNATTEAKALIHSMSPMRLYLRRVILRPGKLDAWEIARSDLSYAEILASQL